MKRLFSLTRHPMNQTAASSPAKRRASSNSESGSILVIAIFILAILLSLVVALASTARVDLKASMNFTEGIDEDALIDAAVAHAEYILVNDSETGVTDQNGDWATLPTKGDNTSTTTNSTTASDTSTFAPSSFTLNGGQYEFQIVDASSLLNLNTATRDELMLVTGMTDQIADSIVDWRDTDDTASDQGAESDTYENYPRPYAAKNGPFDTVDELLMVQGITPSLLYGDPTQSYQPMDPTVYSSDGGTQPAFANIFTVRSCESNVATDGTARINLNSASASDFTALTSVTITQQQAQAIVNKKNQSQYASVADLLDVQGLTQDTVKSLVDLCTISSAKTLEGRINVNTASMDVLMTIPNMTSDVAQSIISNRPYATAGDLLNDSVMETSMFRQIINYVSTKSSIFIIRVKAIGKSGGLMKAAEVTVEQQADGTFLTLRRKEVSRWPGWLLWNWSDNQTSGNAANGSGSARKSATRSKSFFF